MDAFSPQRFFQALDATWAPDSYIAHGPFTLRVGLGGGKRVSAASLQDVQALDEKAVEGAEEAMNGLGQTPIFMIRAEDGTLDALLEARGYQLVDQVNIFAASVGPLAARAEGYLTTIAVDTPLAVQREIWAEDGIGPARLAVMDRSAAPKSFLMGRIQDRASATAFVSCDNDIAMLHSLTVAPAFRRQGMGAQLTFGAAKWAARNGASTLALAAVRDNVPATRLYESLSMTPIASYHYRVKP